MLHGFTFWMQARKFERGTANLWENPWGLWENPSGLVSQSRCMSLCCTPRTHLSSRVGFVCSSRTHYLSAATMSWSHVARIEKKGKQLFGCDGGAGRGRRGARDVHIRLDDRCVCRHTALCAHTSLSPHIRHTSLSPHTSYVIVSSYVIRHCHTSLSPHTSYVIVSSYVIHHCLLIRHCLLTVALPKVCFTTLPLACCKPYTHTHTHTHTHTYIYTSIHTSIHIYICICIHQYNTYIYIYV